MLLELELSFFLLLVVLSLLVAFVAVAVLAVVVVVAIEGLCFVAYLECIFLFFFANI